MTRLPTHRAHRHAEIRARLHERARIIFPDHVDPGGWDPSQTGSAATGAPFGDDLGRGLLDAFALAVHVLWTYQEAWADEGFLPLAALDSSVSALLRAIGYQPAPGTAAIGLQHLRCVQGAIGVLPAGFKVTSAARGDEAAATYETLHPLRLDPALNELRAWSPATASGEPGALPPAGGGDTSDVPRLAPLSAALGDRLAAGIGGDLAARRGARARVEMRRLADTIRQLRDAGGDACTDVLDALCEQLCEAQREAAAGAIAPGQMSESQRLARRQLGKLAEAGALSELERALARCPGESDDDYRARLDAMARFLDAFVSGLVQDARDQVVLLRGPRALARLDRAVRGGAPATALGSVAPGTDSLVLLTVTDGRIVPGTLPMLRTGDWLVLGEEIDRVDDDGQPVRERVYREAMRVVSASDERIPGAPGRFTRVVFEPPLARGYQLDRVVLLGNIAVVSEGQTVEELRQVSLDGRTFELSQRPLTWLAAPRAAGGRRPECRVWIGSEEWTRTEHLLSARATARVFAVEPTPGGGARLRFGDGASGALVPSDASVRVRYRVGLGVSGNRDALRVDGLRDAHPAADSTFNPLAIAGGSPPEDREAARVRAPAVLRAMDRAVSLDDVRALALTFGGVQRAEVHRGARRGELRVTVSGTGGRPLDDLAGLEAFLRARVAPGVRITARPARAVAVYADILLRVAPGADPLAVMRASRVALGADEPAERTAERGLLHPDRTRIDGDLRLSEVYAALDGIDGLSSSLVRRLYRQSYAPTGEPIAVTEAARVLSDRVMAAEDERLVWAPAVDARDGVSLEYEQERDR